MAYRIKQLSSDHHQPRSQSPSDLDSDTDLDSYLMSGSGAIPSMEASGDELKKDTVVVGEFWLAGCGRAGECALEEDESKKRMDGATWTWASMWRCGLCTPQSGWQQATLRRSTLQRLATSQTSRPNPTFKIRTQKSRKHSKQTCRRQRKRHHGSRFIHPALLYLAPTS